jgi:hypothetical protein
LRKKRSTDMKTRFWNAGIEIYGDGTVKAAVLRNRKAEYQPPASYRKEPGREGFSFWYGNEEAARGTVVEALAMNRKQEAAA